MVVPSWPSGSAESSGQRAVSSFSPRPCSNNLIPVGHRSGVSIQLRGSYNKSLNTGQASKRLIHFSTSVAGQPVKQTFGIMNTMLGIAVLTLTVVAWLFFEKRRMKREIENIFRDRPSLSDNDFYAAFFQDSGISCEIVSGVREVLAEELNVDVTRMIPNDDFSCNLRFLLDNDSMIDVALIEGLEKRFKITILDKEAENTKTIHDIIALVHRKTLSI